MRYILQGSEKCLLPVMLIGAFCICASVAQLVEASVPRQLIQISPLIRDLALEHLADRNKVAKSYDSFKYKLKNNSKVISRFRSRVVLT